MTCLKLPSLALLGVCFTGCGEDETVTIAGVWKAVELRGIPYPWVDEHDGIHYAWEVELRIKEDLTAVWWEHLTAMGGPDDYSDYYEYPVDVDEAKVPAYTVTVPEKNLVLDCELKATELNCTRLAAGIEPDLAVFRFHK